MVQDGGECREGEGDVVLLSAVYHDLRTILKTLLVALTMLGLLGAGGRDGWRDYKGPWGEKRGMTLFRVFRSYLIKKNA